MVLLETLLKSRLSINRLVFRILHGLWVTKNRRTTSRAFLPPKGRTVRAAGNKEDGLGMASGSRVCASRLVTARGRARSLIARVLLPTGKVKRSRSGLLIHTKAELVTFHGGRNSRHFFLFLNSKVGFEHTNGLFVNSVIGVLL